MKTIQNLVVLATTLLLLSTTATYAQLTGYQNAYQIDITENRGQSGTDYPFLLFINTADMITNGTLQADADDMRFATDCSGSTLISYYIEGGINTDSTKVWVSLPQLTANATESIFMITGNPSATAASSLVDVFPNSLVYSNDSTILPGTYNYDWFEIPAGVTVSAADTGSVVTINASRIIINGTLDLTASGYGGYLGNAVGSGPGGGGISSTGGAGGGGYGGAGGNGGYDSGEVLPAGGMAYGTYNGLAVEMGSAGAGSSDGGVTAETKGGNGGGSVSLVSMDITIGGEVLTDGENGNTHTTGRCPGGGAGGGILLLADFINQSGLLSANGGDGGPQTVLVASTDGAGGGGGGRIKKYAYSMLQSTGMDSVAGGLLAPSGSGSTFNGVDGNVGTLFDSLLASGAYDVVITPFGSLSQTTVTGPAVVCLNTSANYVATTTGTPTYAWTATGGTITAGQGTSTVSVNWDTPGTNDITVVTTDGASGCPVSISYAVSTSTATPVADFTSTQGNICADTPVQFTDQSSVASGTIVGWNWNFDDGQTSTSQNPSNAFTSGGNFDVQLIVTSDIGCADTTTGMVSITPKAQVSLTIAAQNGDDPLCAEEGYTLQTTAINGGTPIFQWKLNGADIGINSTTFGAYNLSPGDEFACVMTTSLGCVDMATVTSNTLTVVACDSNTVISLLDTDAALQVDVQPNPGQGIYYLTLNNLQSDAIVEVYSLQGQRVFVEKPTAAGQVNMTIDIAALSKGMYLLKVSSEAGAITRKLVKE